MLNYWVVGAMYSGNDDQLELFLRRCINEYYRFFLYS